MSRLASAGVGNDLALPSDALDSIFILSQNVDVDPLLFSLTLLLTVQKRLLLINDWWKTARILIILAKAPDSIVNDWLNEINRILGYHLSLL